MRAWRLPAVLLAGGAVTAVVAAARLATLDAPEPVDIAQWSESACAIDQVDARFPEASYVSKHGRSRDSGQFGVAVVYRYQVEGRERRGDRFCTVDGLCKSREDVRAARALRAGRRAPCWVNRKDPARSAIRLATAGQVKDARTFPLVAGVVGGLLAAFGLVALLRRRRVDDEGPVPVAEVVADERPPDPDPKNLV